LAHKVFGSTSAKVESLWTWMACWPLNQKSCTSRFSTSCVTVKAPDVADKKLLSRFPGIFLEL
jgi:hypothetical protein